MKNYHSWQLLKVEYLTGYSAKRIVICVILIVICAFFGLNSSIYVMLSMPKNAFAEDVLLLIVQSGFFLPIVFLLISSLSTTYFCRDFNSQFIRFIITRASRRSYLIGRALGCFFSYYLLSVISLGSIAIYSAIRLPSSDLFCCICIISNYSIVLTFWCMCGLLLSAFYRNYYAILVTPFALSYAVGRICYSLIPEWLNPNYYMQSLLFGSVSRRTYGLISLACLAYFTACCLLVGFLFVLLASMVMEDET